MVYSTISFLKIELTLRKICLACNKPLSKLTNEELNSASFFKYYEKIFDSFRIALSCFDLIL